MKKNMMIAVFIALIILGYFAGGYLFREKQGITIKDIVNNATGYLDKKVEVRGKAIEYSAKEWVVLEDKGARIFVKHNMQDYYFKYGDKYIVKGEVKMGEVFGATGNKVYINALEPPIRNNSWTWI